MSTSVTKERPVIGDFQRMELRSLVNLAGEPISHFWPMKTFIHHNPLHGLEHLHFEKAIEEAERVFRGRGFLPNEEYRNYYSQDRITKEALDEAIEAPPEAVITIGNRKLSQREVLHSLLVHGTGEVPTEMASALLRPSLKKPEVKRLAEKIQGLENKGNLFSFSDHAKKDSSELAKKYTLAEWCDQLLGTQIQDHINFELIKWCGAFLDEGHAPWAMPNRKKTFYAGWKISVQEDKSCALLGIKNWKEKIQDLPNRPDDAIFESMTQLAIHKDLWIDYFTLLLSQLSGWTGFIKWRSEQTDYEWQNAFPIDLIKYMAVRLFYQKEMVSATCQEKLAIEGNYNSILSFMNDHPVGYGLFKEYQTRGIPEEVIDQVDLSLFGQDPVHIKALDRCDSAWVGKWERVINKQKADGRTLLAMHLAKILNIPVKELVQCASETLDTLLGWVETFPESKHGPVWLKALESSFIKDFIKQFSPNIGKLKINQSEKDELKTSRPLVQALFCIDVRSESFRRHLEEIGGNETFGFAGFFGVPICYQGFASEQQTDQCPVLLKPKHVIKEIPRAYQANTAEVYLERKHLAHTGHTLLHDLKENVITPYIMVEAIGWFFGIRLFGQTLNPKWYKKILSWINESFTVDLGTTLTVDKIDQEEAKEMVASQHRAAIYRHLIEYYGQRGSRIPHDEVERLRKMTLSPEQTDSQGMNDLCRLLSCPESDLKNFIRVLRDEFHINERDEAHRMHRITQTGFTDTEQANFVETALRVLGFTNSFARLILFCAHGSTSDNNPYESALDCGACGGNHGHSNARALAVMANRPQVRKILAERGFNIPMDTHFLPGQHDTVTDEVELYDLEEVPATHRKDLRRLQHDLKEAGERNSRERLARLPDASRISKEEKASPESKERSIDWSQVRPEWGLSRHTTFIVGRRVLTQGINLERRSFLHSYDPAQDPTGKSLEIIMTAPMIVGNWINMEHYFSTVDPNVYGAGSKVYHNVVSRVGVMYGSQSDLCVGLPVQTVFNGDRPFHEPMRLFVIIEAPLDRILSIIKRHDILQRLTKNEWINIVGLDPDTMEFSLFQFPDHWKPIK